MALPNLQKIGKNLKQQMALSLHPEMVCGIHHNFIIINFLFIILAHASCVFKGYIWVTGGRVDLYVMYNLLDSYKVADVWKSKDGGTFHLLSL